MGLNTNPICMNPAAFSLPASMLDQHCTTSFIMKKPRGSSSSLMYHDHVGLHLCQLITTPLHGHPCRCLVACWQWAGWPHVCP